MTPTQIDLLAESYKREIREMGKTARRSLGQRFGHITRDSRKRFARLCNLWLRK